MSLDEKWAERDRKREAYEAKMERQREESRQRHIAIVEKALREGDFAGMLGPHGHATLAIDALVADGVVFARMGTWDEGAETSSSNNDATASESDG